jgi:hypothetical protein
MIALTQGNLPNRHGEDEPADDIQWVSAGTAPDQLTAEMWQQLLRQESVPSMLAPHDAVSFMGLSSTPVRVMVPAEMVLHAQEILAGVLGDPGSPETDDE